MLWYVTGAKGFVGKTLTAKLTQLGEEVDTFVRGDQISKRNYDVVINCAAEIHQPDLTKLFESNVALTSKLLDMECNHFIQIGSSSEYGDSTCGEVSPNTPYGVTKAAASLLVESRGGSVVRPYSLYGAQDNPAKFIPFLLYNLANDFPVTIFNGEHDWVYIDDFVDILISLGMKSEVGSFDVCSGKATSNLNVALKLSHMLESKSKIIQNRSGPYRSYDRDGWVGDITRMPPGTHSLMSLEEGLEKCIQNYTKEF